MTEPTTQAKCETCALRAKYDAVYFPGEEGYEPCPACAPSASADAERAAEKPIADLSRYCINRLREDDGLVGIYEAAHIASNSGISDFTCRRPSDARNVVPSRRLVVCPQRGAPSRRRLAAVSRR